jgi:hypothetical protein
MVKNEIKSTVALEELLSLGVRGLCRQHRNFVSNKGKGLGVWLKW